MSQVVIQAVSKAYEPGRKVLDAVSLAIEPGELFFLLGPSGCGKSTLLRILAGLVTPDAGRITLAGRDITGLPPEQRNTPMVFQNYALWPHLNVFDNVAYGLRTLRVPRREIADRVGAILDTVRLADCAKRQVTALSGGQQQRVALARALVLNPAVLLLDEPLSNLDAKLRDGMRCEIRRLCKERSLTAVYVTHDRREALGTADRIAVLSDGHLQQVGTPRDVYLRPVNRFCATFLGDANILPAVYRSGTGFETALGLWSAEAPQGLSAGTACFLMFRPECLALADAGVNAFDAVVADSSFLGESALRTLDCGHGVTLTANEFAAVTERQQGDRVRVSIAPERVRVLTD